MPRRPERDAGDDQRDAGETLPVPAQPGRRHGESAGEEPWRRVDAGRRIERATQQEGQGEPERRAVTETVLGQGVMLQGVGPCHGRRP